MMKKTLTLLAGCMMTLAAWAQSDDMSRYAPALANGTEAPEIALPRVDTMDTVRLSDYRGRHVVVDFWATWCGDCRREMPLMREALEEYKDRVEVLSVSFDLKPEQLAGYLATTPTDGWTVVSDYTRWKESAVTKAYALNWIPTFYVVDPDGRIAGSGINGAQLKAALGRIFALF